MEEHTDLMSLHLDSLYRTTDAGDIFAINQWDGGDVPRLHLCRSRTRVLWRMRDDLDAALSDDLTRRCAEESVPTDFRASPINQAAYERLLVATAPIRSIWSGPAFAATSPVRPLGAVQHIHAANAHLLTPLMRDWLPDVPHRAPFVAAIEEERAIAVCASVRITDAAHQAGVEVHPDHRRKGHALTVVSAWAAAVQALGAVPLYSTSWENTASIAVARHLGFELIGADYHVR